MRNSEVNMMKHIKLVETDRNSAKTGWKKLENIQWEGKTKPENWESRSLSIKVKSPNWKLLSKWIKLWYMRTSRGGWKAMLKFVDRTYNQATEELFLLRTRLLKKRKQMWSLRTCYWAALLTCYVSGCYYIQQGGDNWPSDRLIFCQKFNNKACAKVENIAGA